MKYSLLLLFLAIGLNSSAQNGALFETLPINTNNRCHSTVLKGRGDYKDVAFVMPQAVLAKDDTGRAISQFVSMNSESSEFRFRLNFPRRYEQSAQERSFNPCDHDNLLEELKSIPGNTVERVSSLIIENIRVSINDLGKETEVLLADPNTTIFNYSGEAKNVSLRIDGRDKMERFKKLLKTQTGVEVDVDFLMQVRSEDGQIKCSLDSNEILTQIKPSVTLSPKLGKKVILPVSLKSAITNAVRNSQTSCYIEASNSDSFDRIVNNALNQITNAALSRPRIREFPRSGGRIPSSGGTSSGSSGSSGSDGRTEYSQEEIQEAVNY